MNFSLTNLVLKITLFLINIMDMHIRVVTNICIVKSIYMMRRSDDSDICCNI